MLCFLGTFTLKIPLIDFPTVRSTESLGMETETPDDQSSESKSLEAPDNQSGESLGMEIADNQGTYAMIEEIGNCEVMPEFPNACEIGTPHEASLLSDKDIEEMLCALCHLPDAQKETVNTEITTEMDEDLREVLGLDVSHFVV